MSFSRSRRLLWSKTTGEGYVSQGKLGQVVWVGACKLSPPQQVPTENRGPVFSLWEKGGFHYVSKGDGSCCSLKCQEQASSQDQHSKWALRQPASSGNGVRVQEDISLASGVLHGCLCVGRGSVCAPVCLQTCTYANARGRCQVLIYYLFSALFL